MEIEVEIVDLETKVAIGIAIWAVLWYGSRFLINVLYHKRLPFKPISSNPDDDPCGNSNVKIRFWDYM